MIEIDTLEGFDRWSRDPDGPAAVQGLDLRSRCDLLCELRSPGTLFLACELTPHSAGWLVQNGAVVVPDLPDRAFTVHRSRLYAAEELYDRFDPARLESFADCLDQRIYRQYLADGKSKPRSMAVGLWQGLHDHSISDALWELLDGHRVVAVMGGHGMERRDLRYRTVVYIAKDLAERGYLMVSGGGPGAMEATHLGVWLAHRPSSDVEAVLASDFARRPSGSTAGTEYADADWLVRAWRVRQRWPRVTQSISVGMPTWLYGHEPPTPFATHIAKYFANSIREDGVLSVANHGVVFAPGSAGTMQEIFQDACQNHYGTTGQISPMILLDRGYWTSTKPAFPLIEQVSAGRRYGELLALVDSREDVVDLIQRFEPAWYRVSADPFESLLTELRHDLRLRSNWSFETLDLEALSGERECFDLGDVDRLVGWLYDLGGDDWIDRDRATGFWTRLLLDDTIKLCMQKLGPGPALHSAEALVVGIGDRKIAWRAVLAD